MIIVSDHGFRAGFNTLMTNLIPDVHTLSARDSFQCFPFYTYDEDGTNRQENITKWALAQFQRHYKDDTITKWDIFHYNYGILHHPDYREKYAANLKRDLPHIPFVNDFWEFAKAGARLAGLHVNYESQPEYSDLKFIQSQEVPLDWRVEKMKLSKDKTSLVYNNFLTITGIPIKAFDYRLGNRSALEWVIDQYRVKTHERSGDRQRSEPYRRSTIHRQVDWEGDNSKFGDSGHCKRTTGVRPSLNQETHQTKTQKWDTISRHVYLLR